MGCCYSCYKCFNVFSIQGVLTDYQYDTYDTNIFLNNNKSTRIVLQKSNPDYGLLLEKVKQLKGKSVIITYEQFHVNLYKHVIDIEEYMENSYTGKVLHIVGLARETEKSEYYEIIFENLKNNHVFIIHNEFYKKNTDIFKIGYEYTVNYEFFEGNYYKVIEIIKVGEKNSDGYTTL